MTDAIEALQRQLGVEKQCRLANEAELHRADALIGVLNKRIGDLEDRIRELEESEKFYQKQRAEFHRAKLKIENLEEALEQSRARR